MPMQTIDDNRLANLAKLPATYPKPKLSVSAINILLGKGYNQSDIGRYFSVSSQAVNDYCKRHRDEIIPLKDYDEIMTERLKSKTLRAINTLDDELIKKGGLIGINAFVGTGIEKIRLLEGKSTSNIDISHFRELKNDIIELLPALTECNIDDLDSKINEIQDKESDNGHYVNYSEE